MKCMPAKEGLKPPNFQSDEKKRLKVTPGVGPSHKKGQKTTVPTHQLGVKSAAFFC